MTRGSRKTNNAYEGTGGTWMSGIGAKKVSSQTGELFWSRQNGHKRRDNGEMDGNGAWKTRTCTKDGNVFLFAGELLDRLQHHLVVES